MIIGSYTVRLTDPHPVAIFDAWQNDIGDEAVVALMATIKTELDAWTKKLPKTDTLTRLVSKTKKDAISGLRRAILPTSKVIAASLIKRVTGIAVEEIIDAVSGTDDTEKSSKPNKAGSIAESALESGLDEMFSKSLEDHKRRGEAILDFRTSVCSLVKLINNKADAKLPMFVFVDEVDRCRPTYAIKLLEEIKHIFGISNICFVVSTNLAQLGKSVCAVYGPGFDANRYLKRFFDYHYTLPTANNQNYSNQLLSEDSIIKLRGTETGLPSYSEASNTAHVMTLISTSFGLDLRSQKQVFLIANTAASAIEVGYKIYAFWLLFLSALRYSETELFNKLKSKQLSSDAFSKLCEQAIKVDETIEFPAPTKSHFEAHNETRTSTVSAVARYYYQWSYGDLGAMSDNKLNHYDYPRSNLISLLDEMPRSYLPNRQYRPSISNYVDLVHNAGFVTGAE